MEKKRSERLAIVVKLAENAAKEAAEAFQSAREQLEVEQKKLLSLNQYFSEYSGELPGTSISPDQITRQRNFLGQIYAAREQQQKVVAQQEYLLSQRQDDWQQKHLKHKALLEMVERIVAEENKELSRKEEKVLDDWYLQTMHSQRNHWQ